MCLNTNTNPISKLMETEKILCSKRKLHPNAWICKDLYKNGMKNVEKTYIFLSIWNLNILHFGRCSVSSALKSTFGGSNKSQMRQRIIESSRQKAAKTTGLVRWRINAGPNLCVLVSLLQNSPRRLTNFSTFRTLTFNLPWTCSWCTPPNSLVTPFWAAHRRRNFSVLRMIFFDFTDNRRQNSGRRCPIWRD